MVPAFVEDAESFDAWNLDEWRLQQRRAKTVETRGNFLSNSVPNFLDLCPQPRPIVAIVRESVSVATKSSRV
jgi:hypothetical protein